MAQHDNDQVVFTWSGLRDPADPDGRTTCLVSRESGWRHFVADSAHVRLRSTVFEEWFGGDLCKRLGMAWEGGCSRERRREWIGQAGKKMEETIRNCMNAPMVLVCDRIGSGGGQRGQQWRLPLSNGVRLIARRAGKNGVLVTCFPPDTTNRALLFESHRWLAEVRRIVSDYADLDGTSGGHKLPGSAKHVRRNRDVETNIRFVKSSVWGFASDAPGASWTPPDRYPPERADRIFPLEPRCRLGSGESS